MSFIFLKFFFRYESKNNFILLCLGKSWQEKVIDVRLIMKQKEATALIVTALDEVACMCISYIFVCY